VHQVFLVNLDLQEKLEKLVLKVSRELEAEEVRKDTEVKWDYLEERETKEKREK